jgi:hypothetical protein
MLIGAGIGFLFLSPFLLEFQYGYDHGFGETAKCNLVSAIVGASGGFVLDLSLRSERRVDLRFNTRELLLATAIIAATILVMILLSAR